MTQITRKSWLTAFVSHWWNVRSHRNAQRRATCRPQLEILEDRLTPAPIKAYVVTEGFDFGDDKKPLEKSLRAAILAVDGIGPDGNKGYNAITFDIKVARNQDPIIRLDKIQLPDITKPVIIDATAQHVELNGAKLTSPTKTFNGLTFSADANGSKVYGLTITAFTGDGIFLNNLYFPQLPPNAP